MNRREFLELTGASIVSSAACKPQQLPPKPNIVFILADDIGYADLGCYGQEKIRTPNLDRMAADGIRFTDCYAGAPVCAPSRNVLITGRHTGHTTIRGNHPKVGGTLEAFGEGGRRLSLPGGDVTVAEVLKSRGYHTGITGKWGLGEPGTDGVPTRQGFDKWFGYLNQNHASYYYTDYLWQNETKYYLEGNKGGRRGQYTHDLFSQFALDFIEENSEGPFFLFLAYTIAHKRFEVPSLDPYSDEPWSQEARTYAAMISRLDRDVGRILQKLQEPAMDGSTLVFFSSDNGAQDKPWGNLFKSNGQFRGRKGELYEGGIRVPMIAWWPGVIPAGGLSGQPWYFADILPTLADFAGAEVPQPVDGVNVRPLLTSPGTSLPNRFLYWEHFEENFQQAVRWGSWKGLRLALKQRLLLYSLSEDPGETEDVSAEHPRIVERIDSFMRTARTESPHWPSQGSEGT